MDLAKLKKMLLKKRDSLLAEIQHIQKETLRKTQKDAAGDLSAYTFHMADVATDTFDRDFSMGLASAEREMLMDIEDALRKIQDKSFGKCEACDKEISKSRLKAIPYAKLCIACQEKQDKTK